MQRSLALLFVVIALLLASTASAQEDLSTVTRDITFENLGYDDLYIRGLIEDVSVQIPINYDWIVQADIPVQLRYQASPILNPDRTIITLIVKGDEITSFRPITDGAEHDFAFTISADNLKPGENFAIQVAASLYITPTDCQDQINPGQWFKILNSSSIVLTHSLNPEPASLADLPTAIINATPYEQPAVIFVLPENPDSTTLTVAGQVAARLRRLSNIIPQPFQVKMAGTLTEAERQDANLVMIGLPDANAEIGALAAELPAPLQDRAFMTLDQVKVPGSHGVIQIIKAPWNPARHILIVSATELSGLRLAGQAFASTPTFRALNGSFHFVRGLESPLESDTQAPWLTPTTSLSQLGFYDRAFDGVEAVATYYNVRRPPGWLLLPGSSLTVNLGFTPMAVGSNVIVSIDDVYVGTIDTSEQATSTEVMLPLPVEELNAAAQAKGGLNMVVKMSVSNLLPINQCQDFDPGIISTEIEASTFFSLQHDYIDLPDLRAFPYPFISDQPRTPVTLLIPAEPNIDEIAKVINVAGILGEYAITDFNMEIITADVMDENTHANSHLIVIGLTNRQPFIFQLIDSTSAVGSSVYQIADNTVDGVLQMGRSILNENRYVLNIFSGNQTGLDQAVASLLSPLPFVSQSGSIALVQTGQPPRIVFR